jgi:hypothetical protein
LLNLGGFESGTKTVKGEVYVCLDGAFFLVAFGKETDALLIFGKLYPTLEDDEARGTEVLRHDPPYHLFILSQYML